MKMKLNSNKGKKIFFFFLLIVISIIFIWSLPRLSIPLMIAYVLYLIVEPTIPQLLKLGVERNLAVIIIFLSLAIISIIPVVALVPTVKMEVENVGIYLPKVETYFEFGEKVLPRKIKANISFTNMVAEIKNANFSIFSAELKEQLEKEKAQQYRAFAYAAAIGVAGITTLLALGPCSHTKPIEQSDVSEVRIALPYQHTDFQSDRAIYYRVNDNNSLELAKRIDELFKHRQAVALRNGKLPPGKSHYSSKQVEQLFAEIAGQDGNPVDISRIDYDKTVKSWKDELK